MIILPLQAMLPILNRKSFLKRIAKWRPTGMQKLAWRRDNGNKTAHVHMKNYGMINHLETL